uniref:Reverse transcriptase domain-containing protein n=1 Tax=Latimeria chalumnae TaxID=7897 RepID=H2ZUK9_LATCH
MQQWKNNLILIHESGSVEVKNVRIKRGLLGDSLYLLLFCLTLLPLSAELNSTGYGYNLDKTNRNKCINHLFYMDDLKLYAKSDTQLHGELMVVHQFSQDVGMEFGVDKCVKTTLQHGKFTFTENIELSKDVTIKELDQEGVYKYLEVDESDSIQHAKMKEKIKKEYCRRVRLVLRSEPRADIYELYLPRQEGGRGFIQLETAYKTSIMGMDTYLFREHEARKAKYSIIKMVRKFRIETGPAVEKAKITKRAMKQVIKDKGKKAWEEKPLHGQFLRNANCVYIDLTASFQWLRGSGIKGETESFIMSAQDQALNIRYYQKQILKSSIDSQCRMCHHHSEHLDHILACPVLAPTEYLNRHSRAASYIHWYVYKQFNMEVTDKWYQHQPRKTEVTILWDMHVHTDRIISANKTDIVKDKKKKTCTLIDVTVPSDRNIAAKEMEKLIKYKDLQMEIQRIWGMHTTIIPVVIRVTGLIKKGMNKQV